MALDFGRASIKVSAPRQGILEILGGFSHEEHEVDVLAARAAGRSVTFRFRATALG